MKVLVCGGAGYIGTHTLVSLIESGFDVVVFDNLINSNAVAILRVEEITKSKITFIIGDIRNSQDLEKVFVENSPFEAVIHFAGLKAVGESVKYPVSYYDNNVVGTLRLLEVMAKHKCKSIIFSSSATVYGNPEKVPIPESARISCTNPYGRTKAMIEVI